MAFGVAQAAEIPGVGVKLALSTAKPKMIGEVEPEGAFPKIGYRAETADGFLQMQPMLTYGEKETDYLARIHDGGPIEPPTFGAPEYDVFFPAIDVRVVNNSKDALHITRVDLKVAESKPDPTPLPMVFGGYDQVQYLVLHNEGWGKIDKADFEFDLVSKEPKGKPAGELPFKRSLQRITKTAELVLHDELQKKGVSPELISVGREYLAVQNKLAEIRRNTTDWEALQNDTSYNALEEQQGTFYKRALALVEKGCGPFWKGLDEFKQPLIQCWMHGWLNLTWQDAGETRGMKVAVICPVLIIPPDGLGAPGPVAGRHEAMLRREGADYTLQVPVSHVVKKGGVTRFVVTLGIPETSRHEFSVQLVTTGGQSIDGGKVKLAGLLPTGAAWALTAKEEPAEE